jgi:hypothetical protein
MRFVVAVFLMALGTLMVAGCGDDDDTPSRADVRALYETTIAQPNIEARVTATINGSVVEAIIVRDGTTLYIKSGDTETIFTGTAEYERTGGEWAQVVSSDGVPPAALESFLGHPVEFTDVNGPDKETLGGVDTNRYTVKFASSTLQSGSAELWIDLDGFVRQVNAHFTDSPLDLAMNFLPVPVTTIPSPSPVSSLYESQFQIPGQTGSSR